MAEKMVSNKTILLTSLVVGVVAVGLFFIYDNMQQSQITGDMVEVLVYRRSLNPNDEIQAADVGTVKVKRDLLRNLPDVMQNTPEKRALFSPKGDSKPSYVCRRVEKDDFVRASDVLGHESNDAARTIQKGYRAITLGVDPNNTPGDLIKAESRVDVVGLMSVAGSQPKACTLIERLRVIGVGGHSPGPADQFSQGRQRYDPGARIYRSVTVEVHRDVAESLINLMTRVKGKIWLEVRHPEDTDLKYSEPRIKYDHGAINPELKAVMNQPISEASGLE